MKRLPVAKRWARLGPDNPSTLFHTPRACVCLSAFVIAKRGRSVLLGRPRAHDAWPTRGGYPKSRAAELEKEGAWLLPATHLLMEESPDEAARRIVHQWAGLRGTPRFVMVQSHLRPGRIWSPRLKSNHWDLCFVYTLSPKGRPKSRPWWSEMRWIPLSDIPYMNLGRGHRDILEEAGYLQL